MPQSDRTSVQQDLTGALLRWLDATPQERQRLGSDPREQNRTIQYGQLRDLACVKVPPIGLGPYLTALGNRCEENGLPRLDALVVGKRSGVPGAGLLRSCRSGLAYHDVRLSCPGETCLAIPRTLTGNAGFAILERLPSPAGVGPRRNHAHAEQRMTRRATGAGYRGGRQQKCKGQHAP